MGHPGDDDVGRQADAITSSAAQVLDFRFSTTVLANLDVEARKAVVSQLMYAQGVLMSANNGNGHIGSVELMNVRENTDADKKHIVYDASLPVAWPRDLPTPEHYELALPLDTTAFDAFNAKYDGRCGQNQHGAENFWLDWNPRAEGCSFDDDVARVQVNVSPHARETKDKYPEYDRIWSDGRLDVVAIFGIVDSNTPNDWAYSEEKTFVDSVKKRLTGATLTVNGHDGVSLLKNTTLTGKTGFGDHFRDVKVDVLVVDALKDASSEFDARYDALSERADLILYNGHAGLGENVRALGRKGKVVAGKYQLVLVNGCQSFAYIDTTMVDRRRAANGSNDPNGTRFLDVVGNAMPSYANNLANVSLKLYDAAIDASSPRSYASLLDEMPDSHIAVVFGEEDNTFSP